MIKWFLILLIPILNYLDIIDWNMWLVFTPFWIYLVHRYVTKYIRFVKEVKRVTGYSLH